MNILFSTETLVPTLSDFRLFKLRVTELFGESGFYTVSRTVADFRYFLGNTCMSTRDKYRQAVVINKFGLVCPQLVEGTFPLTYSF